MSEANAGPPNGDRDGALADAGREYERLRQLLTVALQSGEAAAAERSALRTDITALIRTADGQAQAWRVLADAARALPELWKQLAPAPRGAADERPREADASAVKAPSGGSSRSDHLGASTFVAKGWNAYAAAEYEAADAAFGRALDLAPDYAEASALQAWARASLGREDDALLAAQRVLVSRPGGPASSLARVAIGRVCLAKGIAGEAIEHLARVVRDDDDRRATLYATLGLGVAYAQRGMSDDAVAFFRRALALGPNLVEARYELGCTLHAAGAIDAARAEWAAGAKMGAGPWARRCGERLREVERAVGGGA